MFKKVEYWLCALINLTVLLLLYWPLIQWFDKRVDETFEAQGITTAIILTLCGIINFFIIRLLYRNEHIDAILKRLFKTTLFVIGFSFIVLLLTAIWILSNR
jgi:hypothetical protein